MDVKVLDGGLATEIERAGFSINDDALWSARLLLTNPRAIKSVHTSFLENGADIIETATYQASIEGFCQHAGETEDKAIQLMTKAVTLAQDAVQEFWSDDDKPKLQKSKPWVAGSVGPYGACQHDGSEYHGNYVDTMSEQELQNWHRPRLQTLINAGVDILAIETVPALQEAVAIAKLLKEFHGVRAFLTFSCKDEEHTCHGDVFAEAVTSVLSTNSSQIIAIGANCCSPRYITPLLKQASRQNKTHSYVVCPNSGEEWKDSSWSGHADKITLSSLVPEWIDLGARYIGGCCRTTPQDVKDIAQCVRTYSTQPGT